MELSLNRRRLGQVGRWLVLFMLVAQLGAEVHLYSHPLAERTERFGAALGCGTCLAGSQLQHAVAAPLPAMPALAVAWATIVPEHSTSATHVAPIRAFRSRAPPALA
jgi:hypothetical protein